MIDPTNQLDNLAEETAQLAEVASAETQQGAAVKLLQFAADNVRSMIGSDDVTDFAHVTLYKSRLRDHLGKLVAAIELLEGDFFDPSKTGVQP